MALIKCPECKKEFSDTVKKCPHCGYKNRNNSFVTLIKSMDKKKKRVCIFFISGICIGLIIIFIVLFSPKTVKVEQTENGIVRDEINSTLRMYGNLYNDKLSYSHSSISYLNETKENNYNATGYVYFNRQGSQKKWETDFKCECNYYAYDKSATCTCDLGDNAHIVP